MTVHEARFIVWQNLATTPQMGEFSLKHRLMPRVIPWHANPEPLLPGEQQPLAVEGDVRIAEHSVGIS